MDQQQTGINTRKSLASVLIYFPSSKAAQSLERDCKNKGIFILTVIVLCIYRQK